MRWLTLILVLFPNISFAGMRWVDEYTIEVDSLTFIGNGVKFMGPPLISTTAILPGSTFYPDGSANIGAPGKQIKFKGDVNISSGVWLNGSAGTNGQVFTSGGPNAVPTWTTPSGGSGPTIVKTSSTFTATGTTLASIPNLETTLSSNTTYQFDYYLLYQSTAVATGARFAMEFPGTPITLGYTTEIMFAADGAGGAFQCSGTTDNDVCLGTGVVAVNTSYLTHIKGVVTTGASGGVMVPQIACELVSPTQVTSRSGSVGIITSIP